MGLVLVFDYVLNVLVVAVPASRYGVSILKLAREMVGFTLIAQVADSG
jgi:hypothetical protein